MKIIGIEMIPVSMAFRRKVNTAFRGYAINEGTSENNVILKIYTDEGIVGLGEIGTWGIYYSGESQESDMAAIAHYLFPLVLEGADPFNIDLIHKRMDEEAIGFGCAKSGIDFALYDIMGKSLNVPVYQLVGGCYTDKFPVTAAVLGIDEPEVMAKIAKDSLTRLDPGVRLFKTKVGLDYLKDVKRVEAIREAVGPDHYLLLDCNGSLRVKQAIHFGQLVQEFAPVLLEQPVNYEDLEGLAEVKRNVPVPVGACECALTIEDMMRVIRMDACDFFNFKVDRLGGIYKGKQAVGMINAAGKWALQSAQISLGVSWAALAHFSAATCSMFPHSRIAGGWPGEVYPAYEPQYVQVDPIVVGGPKVEKGYAAPPPGPGLGIELNDKAVERYMTQGRSTVLVGRK
jgi:L-Ala-D/L-Glu epimerase